MGHRDSRAQRFVRKGNGLRETRARLEAVLELTADAVLTIDEHGVIDTFNRAAQRMFGLTEGEAVGRNIAILMPEPYAGEHAAHIARYLKTGQGRIIGIGRETVARRRDGTIFPIALAVTESRVDGRRLFTGVIRDLSVATGKARAPDAERLRLEVLVAERTAALLAANRRLERLAATDALTGLANRRRFDEGLETEVARARRASVPLALILCDIDCFKQYNDGYGHPAGDVCLQQVARALRDVFRRALDVVARYGGEEFAIIVPESTLEHAVALAERLRARVWHLAIAHERSLVADRITVSVGVASLAEARQRSGRSLVEAADRALYRAKAGGRNRVCVQP
jgi:diguanylate cyclase (GGDEF)-like protein/PAS domain S-box-containing protein